METDASTLYDCHRRFFQHLPCNGEAPFAGKVWGRLVSGRRRNLRTFPMNSPVRGQFLKT